MCAQDREEALRDAIIAVKKYVKLKEECCGRHEAFVGVSVNGKDQHGIRTVFVDVTNENVKIVIEDFHTLCSHNTNEFTPASDEISIINNTLQIRPKNSLFGLSVIEITAKD